MAYEETEEKPPRDLQEIAEEALENYKLYKESYSEQEKREVEDLSWQDPYNMWDQKERDGRGAATVAAGGKVGSIAVPARPTMSVPKIKQPISLVLNQAQSAHLGVQVHPVSEDAKDDTAEVQQDLYRGIERDCNAPQIRFSAFKRSIWAGRGWYRVNTVYDPATPDPFDQKIVLQKIQHQENVFIDPSAVAPDFSDAEWGGLTGWMPLHKFKVEYPDADLAKYTEQDEWTGGFFKIVPDWVKISGTKKTVQVAEYFLKHYEREEIAFGGKSRTALKCRLFRYVLAPGKSGLEVVEWGEWNGEDIPLIPCIADELISYDDKRRFFGMVRPARDACRIFNYAASQLVQRVGVEPLAPFTIGASQLEGYEDIWAQANIRAFGFLPYNDKADAGGQRQDRPQRTEVSSSSMGPAMLLLQQADNMIQSSTATPDVSLGVRDSGYRSGKAEEKLQRQSEAAKSNFLDNYATITLRYEAKVVLGMMKNVYDRPGRIIQGIDMNGNTRSVMLNTKFVKDQNSGKPVRVNDQIVPMVRNPQDGSWEAQQGAQPLEGQPKQYDLSKGFYGVSVEVGKAVATRLEEGSDQLSSFMQADPEMASVLAPLYLRFQDWPGAKDAARLAEEYRRMKYPQIDAPKEGEETPEQLKATMAQMQQKLQEQGQHLQQAADMIKSKQLEMEQEARLKQMEIEADLRKAEMDNSTKIEVANIQAKAKASQTEVEAAISIALDRSKKEQEAFNRRHVEDLGHQDRAHDLGIAAADAAHEKDMAAMGHEQALEAAANQAALAPVETSE